MKLLLSLILALVAIPQAAAPVPKAGQLQLIVESLDGRLSRTPYRTPQACERAREKANRIFMRQLEERQRRARTGSETRIVFSPVCLPL